MNGDNNMAKNTTSDKPKVYGDDKTKAAKPLRVAIAKIKLSTVEEGQEKLNERINSAVLEHGGTRIRGQVNIYK